MTGLQENVVLILDVAVLRIDDIDTLMVFFLGHVSIQRVEAL